MKHDKKSASIAFDCSFSNVKSFNVIDPLNNIAISGYICKQEGPMGGALIIITVDGQSVEPQLIYSIPKIYYPMKQGTTEMLDVFDGDKMISSYYFTKKWDGVNIVFYKYFDVNGKQYITGKTKGSAILNDCEFGNFLTFCNSLSEKYKSSKEYQEFLHNDEIQGISFELCGSAYPLFIQYDFELEMFPLFKIYYDGKLVPFINKHCVYPIASLTTRGPEKFTSNLDLIDGIKKMQDQVYDINQNAKKYVEEGYVLYLMDRKGYVADKMYKIKPKDIQENNWTKFDENKKIQIRLALQKLEMQYTEEELKKELDIANKDWEIHKTEILSYADSLRPIEKQLPPGSQSTSPISILISQ